MIAFLKLIRFPNLLIIALTQYLIRWCVIYPILRFNGLQLQMSEIDFFLLSLSTVMIAAAGYTINDYFDTQIDRVNKPGRIIVGTAIKRRIAIGAHLVMNFIAIAIGVYLAYKVNIPQLAFIHIISAAALWFYSTTFKKQLLIGNLMIALLAAIVPLIVALYEIPLLTLTYGDSLKSENSLSFLFYFISGYSIFAFFTNMTREIIKDMEDYEGDKKYNCITLPIKYGIATGKVAAIILITAIMSSLSYIQYTHHINNDLISFYYFLIALQLPFAFSIYITVAAKEKKHFSRASMVIKITMLTGILSMFIFYFTLK